MKNRRILVGKEFKIIQYYKDCRVSKRDIHYKGKVGSLRVSKKYTDLKGKSKGDI